jgi:hypothetical protein
MYQIRSLRPKPSRQVTPTGRRRHRPGGGWRKWQPDRAGATTAQPPVYEMAVNLEKGDTVAGILHEIGFAA